MRETNTQIRFGKMNCVEAARLLRERFVDRHDLYAVQKKTDAGSIYIPERKALTEKVIQEHLAGNLTLGIYPGRERTSWLCLDIDTREENEVLGIFGAMQKSGAHPLIEDSGNKGFHIWLFFGKPVPNWQARRIGMLFSREHEMFPKQDKIEKDCFGSLIKLPLGIHLESGRRSHFVDENLRPVADQISHLADAPRCDGQALWQRLDGRKPDSEKRVRRRSVLSLKPCVQQLLASGVSQGQRNSIGHAIASELRRTGRPESEARGALTIWNLRNNPPLAQQEIFSILRSAFSHAYEYGCGARGLLRSLPTCQGTSDCSYYQTLCGQR